jgi:hypothetical protein
MALGLGCNSCARVWSVSLEVGRDGADLFPLWLIATAPIVDRMGETCALFNDDVSLENINLKFRHGFYRLHLSGQDAIADRNTRI